MYTAMRSDVKFHIERKSFIFFWCFHLNAAAASAVDAANAENQQWMPNRKRGKFILENHENKIQYQHD
jgi:hypothetical protein